MTLHKGEEKRKMLYSNSITDRLLGCLLQNPSLVVDDNYNMGKEFQDEFLTQLHKIIYVSVYNLFIHGSKTITIMDINEFLAPYEAQYNIYKDNDGDSYVETIVELTDKDNFENYYNDFMKLSCLRYYYEQGLNIKDFFDVDKDEAKEMQRLNEYTIWDIVNYFEQKIVDSKKKYLAKNRDIEETHAGQGLIDVIRSFKDAPMYGDSFCSELLNTVTRGLVDGQLTCFSSPSGMGKTTIAVATMCKICAKKIWNASTQQFEDNPTRTRNGGLYIQFELENETELSIKFVSYISGVSSNIILDGRYDKATEKRIEEAVSILEDSNIHIVYMPNFTQKQIDTYINEYVLTYGVNFVVYDYIQEGGDLNSEMNKDNGGVRLRTDQVLGNFSKFLKDEARKYNIPIYTMTQTNGNEKVTEVIGVDSISGSKAVGFKLDIGGVLLQLRPKEQKALEIIEHSMHQKGVGMVKPNYIYHMYKVRFGNQIKDIKVWVYVDLGTGHMTDCFCTDWKNEPIKVPRTVLCKKSLTDE